MSKVYHEKRKIMSILVNDLKISGHFPDNTQVLKIDPSQPIGYFDLESIGAQIFPALNNNVTIEWDYESDEEMATLYFAVKHLRQDNPNIWIELEMPYIPNARMDRVNNKDEVFTLKYFADFINDLKFDQVLVLDAHSAVSLALINNVKQLDVSKYIESAIKKSKPDVIFMPDEGAHKRYSSMVKGKPSTFGIKHRDWATGDILSYDVAEPDMVKNAKVLIVDDISSRGGTFYFAAKALLKQGAKSVSLYITHCEKTILDGELLKDTSPFDKIYVANPLFKLNDLMNMELGAVDKFELF